MKARETASPGLEPTVDEQDWLALCLLRAMEHVGSTTASGADRFIRHRAERDGTPAPGEVLVMLDDDFVGARLDELARGPLVVRHETTGDPTYELTPAGRDELRRLGARPARR